MDFGFCTGLALKFTVWVAREYKVFVMLLKITWFIDDKETKISLI